MSSELVERLNDVFGNLTPGAIERADLDGMAFTVKDAITALEARDKEIARLTAEVETAERNVYRLQTGGQRLVVALRKIADGDDNPKLIAVGALNHKEPDPKDWTQALKETTQ